MRCAPSASPSTARRTNCVRPAMTDSAPAIFVAVEASALGAAIRQSTWLYMTANVGHILSLMAFAGAIAVMDLRMMGMLAATSPGYILRMARRAAVIAF